MTDDKFKKEIYQPYLETWKILRLIQYADQTQNSDEQWQRYMGEIDRLSKTYPGNQFAEKLIDLLIDAGNVISKMNSGG